LNWSFCSDPAECWRKIRKAYGIDPKIKTEILREIGYSVKRVIQNNG